MIATTRHLKDSKDLISLNIVFGFYCQLKCHVKLTVACLLLSSSIALRETYNHINQLA